MRHFFLHTACLTIVGALVATLPIPALAVSLNDFTKLIEPGPTYGSEFGYASTIGDLNGDGYDDLIVSATGYDSTTLNHGLIYLMYGSATPFDSTALSSAVRITGNTSTYDGSGLGSGDKLITADLNGDGYDDLIVSEVSNNENESGDSYGALYIIYGQANQLTDQTLDQGVRLMNDEDENFGIDLAAGDLNHDGYDDLIIGASANNDAGVDAGATYIIYGTSAVFNSSSLSTAIQLTGEAASDMAGSRVASGNLNGDSYDDLIIGAYGNDDAVSNGGAVYIVYGSGTTISSSSLSTAIQLTGEASGDRAGRYDITVGDLNTDHRDELIIGVPNQDPSGLSSGSVYIVYGSGTTISSGSLSTAVKLTGEAASDLAGTRLASGRLNADGYDDLIIGAYGNSDAFDHAGAAYVIYGSGTTISSTSLSTAIEITGVRENDSFSQNPIVIGDFNNDQLNEVVFANVNDDTNGINAGSIQIIEGQTTPLVSHSISAHTKILGEDDSARTGKNAVGADLNGDGYEDLVIAAKDHVTDTTLGALQIVYGKATPLTQDDYNDPITITATNDLENFANDALVAGDIDNDGYDDIIVGAKTYQADAQEGAVYVLYGQADPLTDGSMASYVRLTGDGGDFGISVALADFNNDTYNDIVIGAPSHDNPDNDLESEGAFYVVYGQGSRLSSQAITSLTTGFDGNSDNLYLGENLTAGNVNGDAYTDLIVSNDYYDTTASDFIGSLMIIYGQNSHWSNTVVTSAPQFVGPRQYNAIEDAYYDSHFGREDLASGDLNGDGYDDIVVGASQYYSNSMYAGAVYLFYGNSTTWISSTIPTPIILTGEHDSDETGQVVNINDQDHDGYVDLFIASQNYSTTDYMRGGALYHVPGQSTALTSQSLSNFTTWAGEADYGYGYTYHLQFMDLNGDSYDEIVAFNRGDNYTSQIYLGYSYIDYDHDGSLAGGFLGSLDDCNDEDDTVSADQTYYIDTDADGLGVAATTTVVCSSTAPTGYVANSNDTNDTIPNNGVEIADDDIDNDDDGTVDEVNTLTANGAHPYYSTLDPTDKTVYTANILSVTGKTKGYIDVTYADHSTYRYAVFAQSLRQATIVKSYRQRGYGLAVHPKGNQVKMINLFSGDITATKRLSKKKFSQVYFKQVDLRKDGSPEAVIIASSKKLTLTVIVRPKLSRGTFKVADKATVQQSGIVATKTKIKKSRITLRSRHKQTIQAYRVSKKYHLKAIVAAAQ